LKTRIFISRVLDPDSPLNQIGQIHPVQLTGESLIHIEPIDVPKLPVTDWIFFYSKNGVESFAKQWQSKWMSSIHNDNVNWAAMGEGTATAMTGWGIHCDFVGYGDTEQIAEKFLKRCNPYESVLFIRATHSRNLLYEIVSRHREATSIAIYDNFLLDKQFPPMDIGIFTSSRNAIAYFENNPAPLLASIAIGKPTAETLLSLHVPENKIYVAEKPTEESMREVLLRILNGEF